MLSLFCPKKCHGTMQMFRANLQTNKDIYLLLQHPYHYFEIFFEKNVIITDVYL